MTFLDKEGRKGGRGKKEKGMGEVEGAVDLVVRALWPSFGIVCPVLSLLSHNADDSLAVFSFTLSIIHGTDTIIPRGNWCFSDFFTGSPTVALGPANFSDSGLKGTYEEATQGALTMDPTLWRKHQEWCVLLEKECLFKIPSL